MAVLPAKNLARLTWLLSFTISVFLLIFLLISRSVTPIVAIVFTTMSAVIVLFIGFFNIYLLTAYNRLSGLSIDLQSNKRRYIYSYIGSALIHLTVWPLFAYLARVPWKSSGMALFFVHIISSALVNTLMIIIQNFILLQSDKAKADLELSELRAANAEAATLLLKQQIHPHFLFNSLNTLKVLYNKDPKMGNSYLMHLANFLRATVSNHEDKLSRLDEELLLFNNYLQMKKIRFGDALSCIITIPDDQLTLGNLPAFSLQPLLENAIKHNDATEEMPLKLIVVKEGDRIIVSNNLQRKRRPEVSTGKGLANLSERYRLLSGDEVIITDDGVLFSVSLKLLI